MKEKLPLYLENNNLPEDNWSIKKRKPSYGYVSIMYILSIIVTLGSIITILVVGK